MHGHDTSPHSPQGQLALAQWSQRKWVWVPDEHNGYLAGWVVKDNDEDGTSTVALESGDETRTVETDLLTRVNPPNFDGVGDIADLTYLNEASVVHNLRLRFQRGDIYTYSGLFLVAVNPYRTLPIYAPHVVESYKSSRRSQNPPHVFAVAERAWLNLVEQRGQQSQSVLVTGESGAGKTENTKKVIQYLAARAADPLPKSASYDLLARQASVRGDAAPGLASLARGDSTSTRRDDHATPKRLGRLEQQILDANPILEAFGNAQTVKNHNSSRFGKFVRIFFTPTGSISGAAIDWYLLEKSRVVSRSRDERAFHVFFQMLRGADRALLEKLLLADEAREGPAAFEYLAHSRQDVDGMDDREEWAALLRALDTVGFTSSEQLSLFRTIATILHLGQLSLSVTGSSTASLSSRAALEKAAYLLGVPADALADALLRPRVRAGRELVVQSRSKTQVVAELGALAKSLYEKNFAALVERINRSLAGAGAGTGAGARAGHGQGKEAFIGVLDIAGFEIFDSNGFEQLCINYTNEKLQQFFNHHMFVLEQEEYAREDIQWDFVNFGLELQPTIDLIEGTAPLGVLACLEDASITRKSDASFTDALHQLAATKPPSEPFKQYTPSRLSQGFTIAHYAGKVEYRTDGWIDKNRDPLNDSVTALLARSGDEYVKGLFAEIADPAGAAADADTGAAGPRTRVRKGNFRTVGQRHKEQLAVLLSQLHATQPHFVRCIVPNPHKSPSTIDAPLVLDQLRCNGVLEGIRIARLGYPNRLAFADFRRRFELLLPLGALPSSSTGGGFVDGAEACATILRHAGLVSTTYRLGLTKAFFKAGILAELEERRDAVLNGIVTRVQATARRFVARRQAVKVLHRAGAVRTIQRNARIYAELRAWPWWPLFQRVRPLLAAARSDDELRRREAELVEAKRKADEEEQTRRELEERQARLVREQDELARCLEQEKQLGLEHVGALERAAERELKLQDELEAAQADYDAVAAQLDEALSARRSAEDRVEELGTAYAGQTKLVEALQAAQAAAKQREAELARQTSVDTAEWERVRAERADALRRVDEAERGLAEVREDRRRERERLGAQVRQLEGRVDDETRASSDARAKFVALEADARAAKAEVALLQRAQREGDDRLKAKEGELERLRADASATRQQLDVATDRARKAESLASSLQQELASQSRALESSRAAESQANADRLTLKKLVDEHASDRQRAEEVAKIREAEIADLKFQLSKVGSELTIAQRDGAKHVERLQGDLDAARSEATDARTQRRELERKVAAQAASLGQLEDKNLALERAQQAHELEFELLRTETAEQMLHAREKADKELAGVRAQFQVLEDDAVQARRDRDAALRDVEAFRALYDAEQATVRQREADLVKLDKQVEAQRFHLLDLDKINGDLRAELASTKARLVVAEEKAGRTVVEHIRVLEEAQRLQNAEMDRIRADRDKRDAYVRTLEHARTALTRSLEDVRSCPLSPSRAI
ncbi:putative nonmuscle myosin heavy chain b [Rhodotorula diobovata]|uniref:Putative nonmuscle myosin heavy chain b n=1 Tax=Rhodotorula diobovata TaxID=5288 RepID=A0A5C5FTE1_9BASI|nr:putative nonmuscle myosin heavy chain b [Rhodotorula diobovata]